MGRMRLAVLFAGGTLALGTIAAAATTAVATAAPAPSQAAPAPILIGIVAAKTGPHATADLEAAKLLQLRLEQANRAGGVLGRRFATEWRDTESDATKAGPAATELVKAGAAVLVAGCDYDSTFAALRAAGTGAIPGLSLCAASPQAATPAIVGRLAGTFATGADAEGAALAEWLRANEPKRGAAYILTDTDSAAGGTAAAYFRKRWTDLGGTVCGRSAFSGATELGRLPAVVRKVAAAKGCSVVLAGTGAAAGPALVEALRDGGVKALVAVPGAVNGLPLLETARGVSDVVSVTPGCLNTYCSKSANDAVARVNAQYRAKFGQPLAVSASLHGYTLGEALVAAIGKAKGTGGGALGRVLFGSRLSVATFTGKATFGSACRRPLPARFSVERVTKGATVQVGTVTVQRIPDLGDANPCAAPAPRGR